MIALPSWENVEVLVYRDAAGAWWREADDVVVACVSGEQVDTASGSWRVELPATVPATAASGNMSLDLATAALDFEVSQDEETVGLSLVWPDKRLDLGHRAQHYTLLLLARHRKDEPSGWLHPDALCAMQRCRLRLLNLHVHRTRKSLAEHSVRGAGGIVERRPGTRELRLGITQVSIRMMED
jgi:hypothetical protein